WQDNFRMGGYQLMVTGEVLRGRYYKGFDNPQPLSPNKVTEFNVYLIHKDHCFKSGHKIMVQVQSTWFPVIDRNPQKYVENIFKAKNSDYFVATQRIFQPKSPAPHKKLPVLAKYPGVRRQEAGTQDASRFFAAVPGLEFASHDASFSETADWNHYISPVRFH